MDPQLTTKGSSSPVPGIKQGERFVDLYDVVRTTCAAREFTGESLPDIVAVRFNYRVGALGRCVHR